MGGFFSMSLLIKVSYFVAAVLFIVGLRRMSAPATARGGIVWAGVGMVIATLATFGTDGMHNQVLIISALASATVLAWISGKKVAMTDMPQMVALYNGMGGGSAAFIGAMELFKAANTAHSMSPVATTLALVGVFIGGISLSGSLIAFGKLQGLIDKRYTFPGQNIFNALFAIAVIAAGVYTYMHMETMNIWIFFGGALVLGILMTMPIGGADMPVVISLYNAFTGLAVSFEGYVLQNEAMIIAGMLVGAAGTLLTQLMAKAMNRSLGNVLFGSMGGGESASGGEQGEMKEVEGADAAIMMAYSERVIIVPGYGLAVAQAQHKLWELTQMLTNNGVDVKFAIHPVAGRMPGHMNVLLAEAGVPYDMIEDMEDINPQFNQADVALVIGANDVVNPAARDDPGSSIYGMPILEVDNSKNVIVIKRGRGTGFAGIQNGLFFKDNTKMLFGDAQEAVSELIQGMKEL
ncbi:MAG TPA: NAD(P)(+) transhydrogenase (Re/Si-specific) subunit beta [Gammaproteobacteria bacterium]|nr:NAD(P)(+) transhydrogenase (Re/Si-specific) subunit beta [Gammaproteobacteria bacterium]HPI94913.1 NAD(P)(+) transhydrogenase (Re/Si-specific) subunit beta [Gammaproteobacteria bacterium]HPQ86506.1 NAD(P)(+) transhydrogenase (Re/Si-specific) subunit beta [Gammaproteobacteria bacterium]